MKLILRLAPLLFAAVIVVMTVVKYDFLRSLGWDPIRDPTFDWPSGLALGRFGFMTTAAFIAGGSLLSALGYRLFLDLEPGSAPRAGCALLALAGIALAGLAFTTDPTIRSTPATWHGQLHDSSFVLLGLSLMPALIFLGAAFRRDKRWNGFAIYTWITAALAIPTFALKGAAFYVFLLAMILWTELVAWRVVK